MQVEDSGMFTEVPRSAQASTEPRWSPSQGILRKGQAPSRGNSVDSPGPSPRASGSLVYLSRTAPRCLRYQAFGRNAMGLVPSIHGGGHTTNTVGMVSQDLQTPPSTSTVRVGTFGQEVCKPH